MLLDQLNQRPIVPVYYNDDIELCKSVLKQCYDGGVRVFEFVDRGAKSKENFSLLLNFRDQCFSDLMLGVGTVKNEVQAQDFITLGADFLVSPIVNPAIAEVANRSKIEWIPGCMTVTEIAVAEQLGSVIVKLFPADVVGPGFLKAIKPLFPSLHFMVTGGVSLSSNSLKSWFSAGATVVGLGSKLFDGEFVADNKDVVANLQSSFEYIRSI